MLKCMSDPMWYLLRGLAAMGIIIAAFDIDQLVAIVWGY